MYNCGSMQGENTAKPLLLVTVGLPGSGKSFFARRFADTFGAPLISFDEIRDGLFEQQSYSNDEDYIVARVAGLQLRELIKTKKTIVIDGGHNPKVSREELSRVARTAGYTTLVIWIQADERIAKSRAMKRRQNKDDDQFNRSLTDEEFTTLSRRFTAPNERESYVVVSGHHTYPTQAKVVLKRLAKPHEPAKSTPPERPWTPQNGRRPVTIN